MSSGIYSITLNDDVLYIGQSKHMDKRWLFHKYELKKNIHKNKYLQRLYNKYGDESVIFSVVEYVDDIDNLTKREIYYIRSMLPKCNMTLPDKDDKWQPDEKRNLKISKALSGKPKSYEHRKNISIGRTGMRLNYDVWNKIPITYSGTVLSIQGWEKKLGMKNGCLNARIRRGWTIDRAIEEPVKNMGYSSLCGKCGSIKVKRKDRIRCPIEWKHKK